MTTNCIRRRIESSSNNVLCIDLGFNFVISPRRRCCSRSQSDSQFFCPVYKLKVNKSSTSVVYNRLKNSKRLYPIFYGCDCSLSTSVSNWVYHQEAIKCINNRKPLKVPVTWWMEGFFVINMDCSELNSLVLLFFRGYFFPVLKLWLVVLAGETISS